MGCYSARKQNNAICRTMMDIDIVILNEVVKSDRERQISYDIVHMCNL